VPAALTLTVLHVHLTQTSEIATMQELLADF
jgi:hypothetical protein